MASDTRSDRTGMDAATAVPCSAELLGADGPVSQGPLVWAARHLARHHDDQWRAEDLARVSVHDDRLLADLKRRIDAMNMVRSRLIDEIDAWVAANVPQNVRASLHTETLGSVIDRLCIALVRANRLQKAPRSSARSELARRQLTELASAYDHLTCEILSGSRRVPDWRTLKSYGPSATTA